MGTWEGVWKPPTEKEYIYIYIYIYMYILQKKSLQSAKVCLLVLALVFWSLPEFH